MFSEGTDSGVITGKMADASFGKHLRGGMNSSLPRCVCLCVSHNANLHPFSPIRAGFAGQTERRSVVLSLNIGNELQEVG